MSSFKRSELLEPPSSAASPLFYRETSIWRPPRFPSLFPFADDVLEEEQLGYALDLLNPGPLDLPFQRLLPYAAAAAAAPSPLDFFETAADLIQIDRSSAASTSLRRLQERAETDFYLRSLSDRVAALELGFDRALNLATAPRDRKYTWTAEIKAPKEGDGVDRKYKCIAEAKAGGERTVKWTVGIDGKGKHAPASRTYTFQASTAPPGGAAAQKKSIAPEKAKTTVKKSTKGKGTTTHAVEITEEPDQGSLVPRQAFARRAVSKGKRKELSPQDAALMIQMTYREHLVRRSQVLRGLRDLAVAKAKLKEIRALFSNFTYRHRIAIDAEERQRFSEKIIIVLLTVDAIEGPDYMVRAARRSMVDELEMMLEIVDPQPPGKLSSLKRRKFDLPVGGAIQKEMALGVAEVVQMLNEEDHSGGLADDSV